MLFRQYCLLLLFGFPYKVTMVGYFIFGKYQYKHIFFNYISRKMQIIDVYILFFCNKNRAGFVKNERNIGLCEGLSYVFVFL